jgi:hypothetical protein
VEPSGWPKASLGVWSVPLAIELFFHSTICIHVGAEDIYPLSGSFEEDFSECQSRFADREYSVGMWI